MNKWTRRMELGRASAGPADSRPAPPRHHYFAFLSYSHEDSADADWLHQELENFRVPRSLAGRLTANGVIPKRLSPIFRDRHELAAGQDLTQEIQLALSASRCLIVLCSPAAAKSKWTNAEIEFFKKAHPDACVIAAIVAGDPLGEEEKGCFPPALLQKYDRLGRPTGKAAEPLAADLRDSGDGRRMGLLKIIAGILGVGLDDLVQRDHLRRQRRLGLIAAASLAGMVVTSGLAVTAIEARDAARDQRRQAESLISFMLGDLKDRLEPLGKLDVLDEVGPQVLNYYKSQNARDLSDEALAQRSKALTLMGQIADARGKKDRALALYREAYAGTAEALRRKPNDPQRIFNHAQNVFYLADTARQRGDVKAEEAGMREYKRLAQQMTAIDPNNLKWRMEEQYADMDLGILYYEQRRFAEAAAQFEQGFRTISAIASLRPDDRETQHYVPETMAWLADAEMSQGRLADAVALRRRNIALLEQLWRKTGDIAYREKLVPAHRGLGNLLLMTGQFSDAAAELQTALDEAAFLVQYEPANTIWVQQGYSAHLDLSRALLLQGDIKGAASQAEKGCETVAGLIDKNRNGASWSPGLRECQIMQARVALASGAAEQAVVPARAAIATADTIQTSDRVSDAMGRARAYRIAGDAEQAAGNRAGARADWAAALSAVPAGVEERPPEMAEHAIILIRNGREGQARTLKGRLQLIGYRATLQ